MDLVARMNVRSREAALQRPRPRKWRLWAVSVRGKADNLDVLVDPVELAESVFVHPALHNLPLIA